MTHFARSKHMQRSKITACLVASAGWIMSLETPHAQDSGQVTIDARRCMELASPDERLACFDAQVESAGRGERQSSSPAPAPAAAAAPAPNQQSVPAAEVARVPPQTAPPAAEQEWVGTITALRQREPNRYAITLDNGQVWYQRVAERYSLRVGQRVRVYQSKWGSSQRLEADGVKGFIQVELVQ